MANGGLTENEMLEQIAYQITKNQISFDTKSEDEKKDLMPKIDLVAASQLAELKKSFNNIMASLGDKVSEEGRLLALQGITDKVMSQGISSVEEAFTTSEVVNYAKAVAVEETNRAKVANENESQPSGFEDLTDGVAAGTIAGDLLDKAFGESDKQQLEKDLNNAADDYFNNRTSENSDVFMALEVLKDYVFEKELTAGERDLCIQAMQTLIKYGVHLDYVEKCKNQLNVTEKELKEPVESVKIVNNFESKEDFDEDKHIKEMIKELDDICEKGDISAVREFIKGNSSDELLFDSINQRLSYKTESFNQADIETIRCVAESALSSEMKLDTFSFNSAIFTLAKLRKQSLEEFQVVFDKYKTVFERAGGTLTIEDIDFAEEKLKDGSGMPLVIYDDIQAEYYTLDGVQKYKEMLREQGKEIIEEKPKKTNTKDELSDKAIYEDLQLGLAREGKEKGIEYVQEMVIDLLDSGYPKKELLAKAVVEYLDAQKDSPEFMEKDVVDSRKELYSAIIVKAIGDRTLYETMGQIDPDTSKVVVNETIARLNDDPVFKGYANVVDSLQAMAGAPKKEKVLDAERSSIIENIADAVGINIFDEKKKTPQPQQEIEDDDWSR